MPPSKPMHVLIIGAGSTGLLIAQGLKKAGISNSVYERTTEETYKGRPRDWSMGLHWASDILRACLPTDLAAEVRSTEGAPWIEMTEQQETVLKMFDAATGELLVDAPAASSRRASRQKLRMLLQRGVEVHYDKKIVGIKHDGEKVTALFADGSEAVGDLLVGADSASSYVRTYLLGEEKAALTASPIVGYNFPVMYTAEQALYLQRSMHPLFKMAYHFPLRSACFISSLDLPDPEDPANWRFQVFMAEWTDAEAPATSEERLAHVKELGSHFCEPFRSATAWLTASTFIPADKLGHWTNATPWPNPAGRITLAGDAAHAMLPHRGQGLNNAIQDAAHYIKAVVAVSQGGDLIEEMKAYDAEVFERGRAEIEVSAKQAAASHDGRMFLNSPLAKFGTTRFLQMKDNVNAESM